MTKSETLHTPWGNVKIDNEGYYHITSAKEGNNGKMLHRLIYENFWDIKLPTEIIVHHKDGNKLNNCILNLEAMTLQEHNQLHSLNNQESCIKKSMARNTTGYYRVYKRKDRKNKQGFVWAYRYYDEDNKRVAITSVTLERLKEKVLARDLLWIKLSETEAEV